MRLIYLFVAIVAFFSACSFDASGLNAVNINNTNLCENKDCGHGACFVEDGTAICDCEGNFIGVDCTECATGYTGDTCTECATDFVQLEDESCVEDPCDANACSGNGICSPDLVTGDASCLCDNSHDGPDCGFCATDYILYNDDCILDPCLDLDCGDYGACELDSQAIASCNCATGHIGDSCDTCDATNNYVLHEEECTLSPCASMNCGIGSCFLDETSWTGSCDCEGLALGDFCEYPLADILVYKDSVTHIAVQVKDPRWGNFNQTMKVEANGVHLDFYIQSSVTAEGFLSIAICETFADEFVEFRILQSPYAYPDNALIFTNELAVDSKDPQGFIYGNENKFRVQCQGGQIVAPAGN